MARPPRRCRKALESAIESAGEEIQALDSTIGFFANVLGSRRPDVGSAHARQGYDQSLSRQVGAPERVASRVSNFLAATPFASVRAARASLLHNPA